MHNTRPIMTKVICDERMDNKEYLIKLKTSMPYINHTILKIIMWFLVRVPPPLNYIQICRSETPPPPRLSEDYLRTPLLL